LTRTILEPSRRERQAVRFSLEGGLLMKRRLAFGSLLFVFIIGTYTLVAAAKLPKCSSVKCRDLGCPADVLCVSGAHVRSCAEICNDR